MTYYPIILSQLTRFLKMFNFIFIDDKPAIYGHILLKL